MGIRRAKNTTPNEENIVTTETEPTFQEPDFAAPAEPEAPENFDVDAPTAEDTVAEAPVATEGEKPAKEKKESTRPPVPEGKVSPVAFAKILSEHKTAQAREKDPEAAAVVVAPQVVYSYIKNNGPESKNPFPATKAEGRAAVVDPEAALAWWDAKDARVAATKASAAEKAKAKADKAKGGETVTELPEQPAVVEAE